MLVAINGVEHKLDPGKLTFGEASHLEDVTGQTFGDWTKALQAGSAKALRAYALILLRRSDPDARIADVDAMPMTDLVFTAEAADAEPAVGGDEVDPTIAA